MKRSLSVEIEREHAVRRRRATKLRCADSDTSISTTTVELESSGTASRRGSGTGTGTSVVMSDEPHVRRWIRSCDRSTQPRLSGLEISCSFLVHKERKGRLTVPTAQTPRFHRPSSDCARESSFSSFLLYRSIAKLIISVTDIEIG